jgi:hypothetical protein
MIPSFAIVGERVGSAAPPITLQRLADTLVLTWPVHNLPVVLESSADLNNGFSSLPVEPQLQEGAYRVVLPITSLRSEFFRLRLVSGAWE